MALPCMSVPMEQMVMFRTWGLGERELDRPPCLGRQLTPPTPDWRAQPPQPWGSDRQYGHLLRCAAWPGQGTRSSSSAGSLCHRETWTVPPSLICLRQAWPPEPSPGPWAPCGLVPRCLATGASRFPGRPTAGAAPPCWQHWVRWLPAPLLAWAAAGPGHSLWVIFWPASTCVQQAWRSRCPC